MKILCRTVALAVTAMLLLTSGCDLLRTKKFTLTVTKSEGVSGTPEAGNYVFGKDDKADYSYVLSEGYLNLKVKIDGTETAYSGSITMDSDHKLEASALRDVSGFYTGTTAQGYPIKITVVTEDDRNKVTRFCFTIVAKCNEDPDRWAILECWSCQAADPERYFSGFLDDQYTVSGQYREGPEYFCDIFIDFSGSSGYEMTGRITNFEYHGPPYCAIWGQDEVTFNGHR
jgi:hypothetical protein